MDQQGRGREAKESKGGVIDLGEMSEYKKKKVYDGAPWRLIPLYYICQIR